MSSITFVVPSLNEEKNIEETVKKIKSAVKNYFQDYEILLYNDGSTDRTGRIIERLSNEDDKIKIVHHSKPMGLGYTYKAGVKAAAKDYVIMIPGDDQMLEESMTKIFDHIGDKDIIIPYTSNAFVRPLARRIISRTYTILLNILFNKKIKYYNGTVLHKNEYISSIEIKTNSFFYQAEALLRLLQKGHTYIEVGVPIKERDDGTSKAFSIRNIYRVIKDIIKLRIELI